VSLLNGTRGGQLNLGAGPYTAELIVKPVIKTLLSGRPGLRLRVGIDHWLSLVRRMRSGEFELVIAEYSSGTDIICVFALSQVEAEMEKRTLAVIPCTMDWLHSQYSLITLKRHTGSPDAEAFIRLALEADREIKRKEKELAQKYLG